MPDRNFKTPKGLKVRLDCRFFFCDLIHPTKDYTEDEIVENEKMQRAVSNIESLHLLPTMLIQFFTLAALLLNLSILPYMIAGILLYLFGCLWRYIKPDFITNGILMFFSAVYKAIWWLVYIALIVIIFVTKAYYLILPYVILRVIAFVASLLINELTIKHTTKKFGIAFNDTEICAFKAFFPFSKYKNNIKLSDYIKMYIRFINKAQDDDNLTK